MEPEEGLPDTALLTKNLEHEVDGLLHPLIRIFDDVSAGVAHVPRREQADQLPATRFRLRPLLHTLMQEFELRDLLVALMPSTSSSSSVLTS